MMNGGVPGPLTMRAIRSASVAAPKAVMRTLSPSLADAAGAAS